MIKFSFIIFFIITLLSLTACDNDTIDIIDLQKHATADNLGIEAQVIVPALNAGGKNIQVGARPYFLINGMDEGKLKSDLQACSEGPFYQTDFSIAHRGAGLQIPEHTKESYEAAARMGAGIIECDVTFTKDQALVCRHSQCDLHATTNILATPLAANCSVPFVPADSNKGTKAQAQCCTSDITLAEFKTLKGKMDGINSNGTTIAEYIAGTPRWRTDLYASGGTLMTHAQSIELFKKLNVKMAPELKSPSVKMPFNGFSQQDFIQKMINEYKSSNVSPDKVWVQSFNLDDIRYLIGHESDFSKQAVYLDDRYDNPSFDHNNPSTWTPTMAELVAEGVKIIAPPMWMLVELGNNNTIVPSDYAKAAKAAGLDIITWTLERSGPLATGGGWYHQTLKDITNNDGDQMNLLDVLAKDVGVVGVFSDWPATTTYYASCMGMAPSI